MRQEGHPRQIPLRWLLWIVDVRIRKWRETLLWFFSESAWIALARIIPLFIFLGPFLAPPLMTGGRERLLKGSHECHKVFFLLIG